MTTLQKLDFWRPRGIHPDVVAQVETRLRHLREPQTQQNFVAVLGDLAQERKAILQAEKARLEAEKEEVSKEWKRWDDSTWLSEQHDDLEGLSSPSSKTAHYQSLRDDAGARWRTVEEAIARITTDKEYQHMLEALTKLVVFSDKQSSLTYTRADKQFGSVQHHLPSGAAHMICGREQGPALVTRWFLDALARKYHDYLPDTEKAPVPVGYYVRGALDDERLMHHMHTCMDVFRAGFNIEVAPIAIRFTIEYHPGVGLPQTLYVLSTLMSRSELFINLQGMLGDLSGAQIFLVTTPKAAPTRLVKDDAEPLVPAIPAAESPTTIDVIVFRRIPSEMPLVLRKRKATGTEIREVVTPEFVQGLGLDLDRVDTVRNVVRRLVDAIKTDEDRVGAILPKDLGMDSYTSLRELLVRGDVLLDVSHREPGGRRVRSRSARARRSHMRRLVRAAGVSRPHGGRRRAFDRPRSSSRHRRLAAR